VVRIHRKGTTSLQLPPLSGIFLTMYPPRRVAIVHEWLTSMRGGEKVVEVLCEMFPQADVYTLLHVKGSVSPVIEKMPIQTSFIQHLPFSKSRYRHYLPLFPLAIRRLVPDRYDLVISSHHSVAKGVTTGSRTLHVCYCHTPMRYIWGLFDDYFAPGKSGFITRTGARLFRKYLQRWDVRSASHPDVYIANSENVRRRIQSIYGRDAEVIYPPVDVSSFRCSPTRKDYFLVAGALVPYKRVDIAIDAFNQTGERLVVAGSGPEQARLERIAQSNIEFRGQVSDGELRDLYSECRALVFPGEEDFGIIPLEAMASGAPVIALGKGGALETVVDGETGIFFPEQTPAALVATLERFGGYRFDQTQLRDHAAGFDKKIFVEKLGKTIRNHWDEFDRQDKRQNSS